MHSTLCKCYYYEWLQEGYDVLDAFNFVVTCISNESQIFKVVFGQLTNYQNQNTRVQLPISTRIYMYCFRNIRNELISEKKRFRSMNCEKVRIFCVQTKKKLNRRKMHRAQERYDCWSVLFTRFHLKTMYLFLCNLHRYLHTRFGSSYILPGKTTPFSRSRVQANSHDSQGIQESFVSQNKNS